MRDDDILEIGIKGRSLFVKPATGKFPYVYREAMGVAWDSQLNVLSMDESRNWDWDFHRCFRQIVAAAKEQGYVLRVMATTKWTNIPDDLKNKILSP